MTKSLEKCFVCEREKIVNTRSDNGPICLSCARKANKEVCSVCGNIRAVNSRNDIGQAICSSCWGKLHTECCHVCGNIRPVAVRDAGLATCANCLRKASVETCCVCNGVKPVASRRDGQAVCANCRIMTDINLLFKTYVYGAQKRGLVFCISVESFETLVRSPCSYCGKKHNDGLFGGIDRVDNESGYLPNNCVPCCGECNRMKGKLPRDEFVTRIRCIANHLKEHGYD